MRLFTGISLPREVMGNLTRLLDHLRPSAHLRWSAAYNLHITTKFIGEWPEERLNELISELQTLGPRHGPVEIDISSIGWLPNPHSPRILFVGVKAGPQLAALANDTDATLAPLGIERETRDYKPHLTLARIKDPTVPLADLRQRIASLSSIDYGAFTAPSFKLYLSKTGPAGSIYTQVAEIPLTRQ